MMSSKENLFLSLKHNNFSKSTTWKNIECFLIMISSYLELQQIITTHLHYKLILRHILWFALNLFFYTGERFPPQFIWSASKDTKVQPMVALGKYCQPENMRKCTEPERERMSSDLMELNDMELNYISFGDETDSNNTIQMKTSCFIKACFILNSLAYFKFLRVFQSEIFFTRKLILYF